MDGFNMIQLVSYHPLLKLFSPRVSYELSGENHHCSSGNWWQYCHPKTNSLYPFNVNSRVSSTGQQRYDAHQPSHGPAEPCNCAVNSLEVGQNGHRQHESKSDLASFQGAQLPIFDASKDSQVSTVAKAGRNQFTTSPATKVPLSRPTRS